MAKTQLNDSPSWEVFDNPVFYKTVPLACPYLPCQTEQRLCTELPDGPTAQALFDRLSQAGFRRGHRQLYLPECPHCRACVPVRVIARKFMPNKSLRRALRRMANCPREAVAAKPSFEQFELFKSYQHRRHAESDMRLMEWEDYVSMVATNNIDTRLLQIRSPEGHLIACCLFDGIKDGLSAVYSFFTQAENGIGLGSILIHDLIQLALAEKRDYLYLGFWIAHCAKMSYKIRFQPMEKMTRSQGWLPLLPESAPYER